MSGHSAARGLDGLLHATFARYRPEPFVSVASLARMLRLGAMLPGSATDFFGFECRLGGAPPEVDLLVCIAREGGGPEALAAALDEAPPGPEQIWPRLAAFCRSWVDASTPWHASVDNIWLEFDLAGIAEGAAVPVPAVFIGSGTLQAGAPPEVADDVSGALDALAGAAPSVARRVALQRALAALPPGGALFQLGVMLSRADDRLRICASGLDPAALQAYLVALGLPDDTGERSALLAAVGPLCAEIRVGLDAAADGIGSRIGFECYGGTERADVPRWLALMDWLVRQGLATEAERQALLAWSGLQHSRLLRADWPDWLDQHPARPPLGGTGALWRSLNHVKVTTETRKEPSAKAYLASRLVWPTNVALHELVSAIR